MRQVIKKYKDFAPGENDPVFKCNLFITRARPTLWPGEAKYGLIATKKTMKLAHDRNRAKRLLRVWIRENEKHMRPDFDYFFIVRRSILDAKKPEGILWMKRAIKNVNQ